MIILGDFNAQVGEERSGYEEVIGKYGYGRRNKNAKTCKKAAKPKT